MVKQIEPTGIQKKHIIYMDDASWDALRAEAVRRGVTMSSLIRDAIKAPAKRR